MTPGYLKYQFIYMFIHVMIGNYDRVTKNPGCIKYISLRFNGGLE